MHKSQAYGSEIISETRYPIQKIANKETIDRTKEIEKDLRKSLIQDNLEQQACGDSPNDTRRNKMSHNYNNPSIFFTGDFNPLEPVTKLNKHIYEQECHNSKDWMNCFTE